MRGMRLGTTSPESMRQPFRRFCWIALFQCLPMREALRHLALLRTQQLLTANSEFLLRNRKWPEESMRQVTRSVQSCSPSSESVDFAEGPENQQRENETFIAFADCGDGIPI